MDEKITRREFISAVGIGAASMTLAGCGTEAGTSMQLSDRPNILLIMADDMGFSDIGCYGGEIHTPNLDRLADNGLRFTQFYNNGICVPTRASLLTGLYSQQVGIHRNSPKIYENAVTLAEVLKTAGYRTLMTGKWHALQIPVQRGFDRYYGLADGCCNFFNPGLRRPGEPEPGRKPHPGPWPKNQRAFKDARRWAIDDKVYIPYSPEDPDFYTTDAFTDQALDYLDEYGKEGRPFFLYLAYTAPHYPIQARPEEIAKYRGKYLKGWDKLRRERFERIKNLGLFPKHTKLPARDEIVPPWDEIDDKDRDLWDLRMAVYAAMIDRVDQNIGRILDKIEQLGKQDDTLIIFLSDNGSCQESRDYVPNVPPGPVESYAVVGAPWANASNTPFRKYKAWDYEGGICTPCIVHWPRVIKKGGRITHQLAHIIDIMPTLADTTGAEYPTRREGKPVLPMQGKSLLPLLEGTDTIDREPIFWQISPDRSRAVRDGKWKLVANSPDSPWRLYDIEADRFETNDLAEKHPQKLKELSNMFDAWTRRCGVRTRPEKQ